MDRVETVVDDRFAGVSDRGLRHRENQDRIGLRRAPGGTLCVVCDGVSRSPRPERAAEGVVAAFLEHVGARLDDPAESWDAVVVLRQAAALAVERLRQEATCGGECAATTMVAVLVAGDELTVLWVGDSRAYWIDEEGVAQQLTADHTLQADKHEDKVSHVLTRWMAADAGEYAEPDVMALEVHGPGSLLLCSDGLWNYAAPTIKMQELLGSVNSEGDTAIQTARKLVGIALDRGGDDNVSAVLLRLPALAGSTPAD